MTKAEKINWLANATNKELLKQMRRSVERHAILDDKYGFAGKEVIELAEDIEMVMDEILGRMSE